MENKEIDIRRLLPGDLKNFIGLIGLFQEVFETKETVTVDEPYLTHLLQNPGFIAFAIFHNDEIIGGATAYTLPMYASKSTELFIYDVAIHQAYQRRGFGAMLISALKKFCAQNSIGEMFVPAHEEDVHALDFYRSTGGVEEQVVHFNYTIE